MILVLHSNDDILLSTRRMLFGAGILSMPSSYRYALTNPREDKIQAVLLPDPYDKEKPPEFCERFYAKYPHIPVIAFVNPYKEIPKDLTYTHACLRSDLPPSALLENLLVALYRVTGKDYALCMLGQIRDHLMSECTTWCGTPIPLTPTERAILRYLMKRHPASVGPRELLRYCVKPGAEPTLCNIPSHIYRINIKAEEAIGRHLIGRADTDGYRIVTEI